MLAQSTHRRGLISEDIRGTSEDNVFDDLLGCLIDQELLEFLQPRRRPSCQQVTENAV